MLLSTRSYAMGLNNGLCCKNFLRMNAAISDEQLMQPLQKFETQILCEL